MGNYCGADRPDGEFDVSSAKRALLKDRYLAGYQHGDDPKLDSILNDSAVGKYSGTDKVFLVVKV